MYQSPDQRKRQSREKVKGVPEKKDCSVVRRSEGEETFVMFPNGYTPFLIKKKGGAYRDRSYKPQ